MLLAGAVDLLGGAVVESGALRDDGRWCGVDVDQAAVVVLPRQVRSADSEAPCECRVACDERAGFLSSGPQGQRRGDGGLCSPGLRWLLGRPDGMGKPVDVVPNAAELDARRDHDRDDSDDADRA
ncbi:hypothetical protein ACRAKI_05130 [Saccharothrix isguenensis]